MKAVVVFSAALFRNKMRLILRSEAWQNKNLPAAGWKWLTMLPEL